MLTAAPKGWLSRDYEVRDASAQRVGDIRFALWQARGTIWVGDEDRVCRVSRRGVFFGPILLTGPVGKTAQATKLSAFTRAFAIEHGGRLFILRSPSVWFREMRLVENDHEIGNAVPEGVFSRRAQFDLPESLPLELQLFIVWLAYFVWRRWQDSSVSFSGVLQTESRRG